MKIIREPSMVNKTKLILTAKMKRITRSYIIHTAAEAAYYTGSCKDSWCVLGTKKKQRSETTIQVIQTK